MRPFLTMLRKRVTVSLSCRIRRLTPHIIPTYLVSRSRQKRWSTSRTVSEVVQGKEVNPPIKRFSSITQFSKLQPEFSLPNLHYDHSWAYVVRSCAVASKFQPTWGLLPNFQNEIEYFVNEAKLKPYNSNATSLYSTHNQWLWCGIFLTSQTWRCF